MRCSGEVERTSDDTCKISERKDTILQTNEDRKCQGTTDDSLRKTND